MADKELRKMNRTELIEIIYALQQNERTLRAENAHLRQQLDDKLLCLERSGSIAEAALRVNHIFEDAERAARQYLDSIQAADAEAAQMLAAAEKRLERTKQECCLLREETEREIKQQKTAFAREVQQILQLYPELATRLRKVEK